jgi:signal transduction histidine kinase/ActR/RegA family two-component response regulator
MPPAPIPSDELERLAALHAYDILDTLPEKAFDDLTRIAAHICQTPVVLVSLVDGQRQWFKSRIGMEDTETSREVSFCAHAILDQHHVLTVPDATTDPRFADNPLVTGDFHLRFYAGAPLVSSTGHAVGALCVIDRVSRQFSDAQRDALEVLGRQIMAQMELRRDLVVMRRQVEQEITDRRRVELERETAIAAARARAEFLAVMSHELRTPMNGVIGMTELMFATDLSEEQRDYLETIQLSGNALLAVINDILDFSSIDAGRIRLESKPLELRRCLDEAVQVLANEAAGKRLGLRCEVDDAVPSWVIGDAGRLRQVLLNLIANAVKFTDYGEVLVRVSALPPQSLRIEVVDSGIGMSAEGITRLFSAFSQLDASSTRRHGGTGLGLVISKRLVELMGGEISVRSQPGVGTTFTVTLLAPLAESPTALLVSQARPPSSGRLDATLAQRLPATVLLVEDNPTNRLLSQMVLERMGYAVDAVASGVDVLNALSRQAYDIVFMDVHMPGMNGLDVTREIRRRFDSPDKPWIVAVTADALLSDRHRCLDAGMNDYIEKPARLNTMQEAILAWGAQAA